MMTEAAKSRGAILESAEGQLVNNDTCEPGQGDRESVMMEQRDAKQSQRKQDKLDGYSEHKYGFDHGWPQHNSRAINQYPVACPLGVIAAANSEPTDNNSEMVSAGGHDGIVYRSTIMPA